MSVFKTTVLGAGSWGTTIAHHLCRAGREVTLWGRNEEVLESIRLRRENPQYLAGHELAAGIPTDANLKRAAAGADMLVFSVPSAATRSVARALKGELKPGTLVLSTAKGLEEDSLATMRSVLAEELGESVQVAVLSGPSFAKEVVLGLPTAVVAAARQMSSAEEVARLFHYEYFRVYTSTDMPGVEYGGALKNVIALACGIAEGAGMGTNARAALITRGLAEMQRLAVVLGGEALTLSGLSGLGDLLLTATGDLSRNRRVGLGLGRGMGLKEILDELGQVAEGVSTASRALELARRNNVEVPIIEETNRVLAGKSSVADSVKALFSRRGKIEKPV